MHTPPLRVRLSKRYKHMSIRWVFDVLDHQSALQAVQTSSVLVNGYLATQLSTLEKSIGINEKLELKPPELHLQCSSVRLIDKDVRIVFEMLEGSQYILVETTVVVHQRETPILGTTCHRPVMDTQPPIGVEDVPDVSCHTPEFNHL
jgi:hypothetical protein